MTSRGTTRLRILGLLLAGAAGAGAVSAQAWVPPAKVGAVNVLFQDVQHTAHLLHDGSELNGFDSESQGLLIEVDYALTDKFSITVGVPYIGARYIGPEPSFFALPVDDCNCWNRGWQDFGVTARYNLLNIATAVTPFVGIGSTTASLRPDSGWTRVAVSTASHRICSSAADTAMHSPKRCSASTQIAATSR